MTRISSILLLSLMLVSTQAYFQDKEHREEAKSFFLNFVKEFTNQYTAISAEGLDYMGAMKLALDYWITKIRIHNFAELKVDYDVNHDILEISAPTFNIDLIIENKYTIPIKIEDLFISIIFNIGPTHFRCAEVEIDYGSVSLDVNVVIEYITKQILSLDIIKSAIRQSEIPIRNVIINAIRSNHQRLHGLVNELRTGSLNPGVLLAQLPNVAFTRVENGEYIINIRQIFSFESQKEKEKKDDL
ncbi:unnamed protein product [Paramecium pentaurelia]|uniref:Uncharacterized protein n=1 Tax=Paramecium pentaurelia TaxID=43138 RepID=A0A8S1WT67_9CILI|nr:unnamed protein product [Paramecium pentaurelia]